MKFSSQIKDAAKYTFRDWKAIVLLGIILCIASTLDETYTDNLLLLFIMVIAAIALLFIEEGYRYKIIRETIEGNNSPPLIENSMMPRVSLMEMRLPVPFQPVLTR